MATAPPTRVLDGFTAARLVSRVTLKRLTRGKAFWAIIAVLILPIGQGATIARVQEAGPETFRGAFESLLLLFAILPPLRLATVIAEEEEEHTYAYLWSRPLPRSSILLGKVLAILPVLMVAFTACIAICFMVTTEIGHRDTTLLARSCGAIALGVVGVGMISVGLGTLAPRLPIGSTIAYLLLLDFAFGSFPLALRNLSVTFHTRAIAGFVDDANPIASVVWILAIAGIWLTVALWRLSTTEPGKAPK